MPRKFTDNRLQFESQLPKSLAECFGNLLPSTGGSKVQTTEKIHEEVRPRNPLIRQVGLLKKQHDVSCKVCQEPVSASGEELEYHMYSHLE